MGARLLAPGRKAEIKDQNVKGKKTDMGAWKDGLSPFHPSTSLRVERQAFMPSEDEALNLVLSA